MRRRQTVRRVMLVLLGISVLGGIGVAFRIVGDNLRERLPHTVARLLRIGAEPAPAVRERKPAAGAPAVILDLEPVVPEDENDPFAVFDAPTTRANAIVNSEWEEPQLPRSFPPLLPDAGRFPAAGPAIASSAEKSAQPIRDPNLLQASGQTEAGPESSVPDFTEIDRLIADGKNQQAHRLLSDAYWKHPDLRDTLAGRIDKTAGMLYFSPMPHVVEPYVIRHGDQLAPIARTYQIPWEYLAKLNRVDPRRIRAGQKLKVVQGPFSVVVETDRYELTIHHQGLYVRRYRVGLGKGNSTPRGRFTVLNKVVEPQYTDPEGRVIEGDDPANPLGDRWIDLGDSYGIHGTIEPESIGRDESRGCVRLLNEDVRELYDLVVVGSEVVIR